MARSPSGGGSDSSPAPCSSSLQSWWGRFCKGRTTTMTTSLIIPPGLLLIVGGLLLPVLARAGLRAVALIALPAAAMWLVWRLPDGIALTTPFLGYDLIFVQTDQLSRVFATVFAIMGFAGGLFALNQKN